MVVVVMGSWLHHIKLVPWFSACFLAQLSLGPRVLIPSLSRAPRGELASFSSVCASAARFILLGQPPLRRLLSSSHVS